MLTGSELDMVLDLCQIGYPDEQLKNSPKLPRHREVQPRGREWSSRAGGRAEGQRGGAEGQEGGKKKQRESIGQRMFSAFANLAQALIKSRGTWHDG
jgi:hypothetical protein